MPFSLTSPSINQIKQVANQDYIPLFIMYICIYIYVYIYMYML